MIAATNRLRDYPTRIVEHHEPRWFVPLMVATVLMFAVLAWKTI